MLKKNIAFTRILLLAATQTWNTNVLTTFLIPVLQLLENICENEIVCRKLFYIIIIILRKLRNSVVKIILFHCDTLVSATAAMAEAAEIVESTEEEWFNYFHDMLYIFIHPDSTEEVNTTCGILVLYRNMYCTAPYTVRDNTVRRY